MHNSAKRYQKVGFTRLNRDVTVFKLGSVRLVFIVPVICPLAVSGDLVVVRVLLLPVVVVVVDDDGLVSFLTDGRRLEEERVRRAARVAAAVNVLGADTELVSPQRRQAVNHVRGRVAP